MHVWALPDAAWRDQSSHWPRVLGEGEAGAYKVLAAVPNLDGGARQSSFGSGRRDTVEMKTVHRPGGSNLDRLCTAALCPEAGWQDYSPRTGFTLCGCTAARGDMARSVIPLAASPPDSQHAPREHAKGAQPTAARIWNGSKTALTLYGSNVSEAGWQEIHLELD